MINVPKECNHFSSKAEYIALSEAVEEVMFVCQLLRGMKISIKLPITARVDNVRSIDMGSSVTTTSCTKYMGIRYKYVNEYVKDGVVEIVFIQFAHDISTF